MRLRKPFAVINTSAGRGTAGEARAALESRFAEIGENFSFVELSRGESIENTVRKALENGFDLIVAVGGDGTVSAAMAAVAGRSVPLAIVPLGTTNLIARELGIPLDIEGAATIAAKGTVARSIDGMAIGERFYFLQIGVGLSALVIDGTTAELKSKIGILAYVGALARRLFSLRSHWLEVSIDGETHKVRSIEATVANNGLLARMLLRNAPDIRMDDGRIDVCILGARTILDYPRILWDAMIGHRGSPRVSFLAARQSVSIRSSKPLKVQADGDLIGTTPIEIKVIPRAVLVITPEVTERAEERKTALSLFLDPYLADLRKQWSS